MAIAETCDASASDGKLGRFGVVCTGADDGAQFQVDRDVSLARVRWAASCGAACAFAQPRGRRVARGPNCTRSAKAACGWLATAKIHRPARPCDRRSSKPATAGSVGRAQGASVPAAARPIAELLADRWRRSFWSTVSLVWAARRSRAANAPPPALPIRRCVVARRSVLSARWRGGSFGERNHRAVAFIRNRGANRFLLGERGSASGRLADVHAFLTRCGHSSESTQEIRREICSSFSFNASATPFRRHAPDNHHAARGAGPARRADPLTGDVDGGRRDSGL